MIEKGHLPWSDFMVHHGVNRPLTRICHCLETAQSQPLACTPPSEQGEFGKSPVEVQDFRKIADRFREIYGIYRIYYIEYFDIINL